MNEKNAITNGIKMLEFYPNPSLTHQGLLQGHHESMSNTLSCNGHGRTGKRILSILYNIRGEKKTLFIFFWGYIVCVYCYTCM